MTTAREETSRLADLLRREHHALAEFLVALSAFDAERRWSELGYNSLFSFLVRELRLSNGAAQNRKVAAELIRHFPQIESALRKGELCLSSVNEVAKVITPENAADVLPRFHGKSARDAAFLAASLRPAESPPERFLVTPVRGSAAPPPEPSTNPGLELQTCEVPSSRGVTAPPGLQTCGVAVARATTAATEDVRPGTPAAPPRPRGDRSRHVPAAVWRAVWERDRGCCAWPLEGGGVCGSTYQLELDHVDGWARGAETTVGETRLLCRTHQDVSARRLYGNDVMNTYTRPKGGRCSEPVAPYGLASVSRSMPRSGSGSGSASSHYPPPLRV